MTQKERYKFILQWFEENMPNVDTELNYNSEFELLVAVILSAQCTDKRVNIVTPELFKQFPTAEFMAVSTNDEVYEYIKSISYPNSKAKNLVNMSKMLINEFDGKIPQTMDELITLPGVGRKTANVMLIVAFDTPAMPVDTHVFRVANRLGLTNDSKTPEQTEKVLVKNIPSVLLSKAHHWFILHGRYVCKSQKPQCLDCGLSTWCKYYNAKTKKTSK